MDNPYTGFGPEAYWKRAVGTLAPFEIGGLWTPKYPISKDMPIATAGSCFAQHIGRALSDRGYPWVDAEPAPPLLSPEEARAYNYGIFSARTQNIYTTRMLRQWLEAAFGKRPDPEEVWLDGEGRAFDPLRPSVEPGGFASADELRMARQTTYQALRKAVAEARVFVFTLGLTESWANAETGLEYASCPGTAAGSFDPDRHIFVNHRVDAIEADLAACLALLRAANPALKVLLTVSPVPLTATASGQHVLTATTYSKSVLRAVAGMAAQDHDFVDYFPSYEIITAPAFRGMFFAQNQRSVLPEGVDFVMKNFFADQVATFGDKVAGAGAVASVKAGRRGGKKALRPMDVLCEEGMLDAFSKS